MSKKYFTSEPHPSLLEEHEDIYISEVGEEILAQAEAIIKRAARPRWKKIADFVFDGLVIAGGSFVQMNGDNYSYDNAKQNKDDLDSNQ